MKRKEAKRTFTYSGRPSIREKAMKKAVRSGNTLSEVIDTLLEIYSGDKNWALPKKTVVVFGNEEIELK
jgi:hypothetical protein